MEQSGDRPGVDLVGVEGHEAGDRMLRDVAHEMSQIVRPGDVLARIGGDEFALLMYDVSAVEVASCNDGAALEGCKYLAEKEGIDLQQVIAVGDGANDLPMLSTAGLGIAFRAKPLVKQSAEQSISTLGLDGILYLLGISDRYQ